MLCFYLIVKEKKKQAQIYKKMDEKSCSEIGN